MRTRFRAVATAAVAAVAGCAAPGTPSRGLAVEADRAAAEAPETVAAVWTTPLAAPAPSALAEAAAPVVAEGGEDGAPAEVVVTASRVTSESDPVGVYGQPEWTTRRRFARSRVYVLPEGQWEFEQWWRGTIDHGEGPGHLFQTEIGVGLPNRFQVDLYGNVEHEEGTTKWSGLQPELRWAPADWGEIPLNPTLYLEYKWNHDANDVAEGKVLFGEDLAPGVHWAMNLSCEQELGGEEEQELAVTQAVSWALADRQFGLGVEFEVDRVTAHGSRDDPEWQFYLGPSFQWRPTPQTHLDFVPLRGWEDAHDWRLFLVFGVDFGGTKARESSQPVASKAR